MRRQPQPLELRKGRAHSGSRRGSPGKVTFGVWGGAGLGGVRALLRRCASDSTASPGSGYGCDAGFVICAPELEAGLEFEPRSVLNVKPMFFIIMLAIFLLLKDEWECD